MARIQIQWVRWRRPHKLGAAAYEELKAQLDEGSFGSKSFRERRLLLNPDSLGWIDFWENLRIDLAFAVFLVVGALFWGPYGSMLSWLEAANSTFWTVAWWIFKIVAAVWCFMAFGLVWHFPKQAVTYWPSIGIYSFQNFMFVRRRFNALQRATTYEEYLNHE